MQTITDCQLPIRWIIEVPDSDQELVLRAFDFTCVRRLGDWFAKKGRLAPAKAGMDRFGKRFLELIWR